jgi:hypothetical protein
MRIEAITIYKRQKAAGVSSRRRGCCQLTNRLRDLPRVLARAP